MLQLEYTPYIWPFVLSLGIFVSLGSYAFRRRHLRGAGLFVLMMAALSVWTLCYILELSSVTLDGKRLWAEMKYLGSAPGPVLWLTLAARVTERDEWLTPPAQLMLWGFVTLTVLVVFTNDSHRWFWTSVTLAPGEPETQVEHGPFFWAYAAVSYLVILASVSLFALHWRRSIPAYRSRAMLMAVGGFVPLGGRILEDIFKVDPFPRVDNVILLFLLSGTLFAVAIFRYRVFDLVGIAYGTVTRNIRAGIVVIDAADTIVEMNPYARGIVGGLDPAVLTAPLPAPPGASEDEYEVRVAAEGGERHYHVQRAAITAESGERVGSVLVLFDITARVVAERQLEALARTDALTGAWNRRYFMELAGLELQRAQRYHRSLVVMMLDIDRFKQINDTYGHAVGDQALVALTAVCRGCLRATDLLARYGGEEFVCLLQDEHLEDAVHTAERLRRRVEQTPVDTDRGPIRVTVSVGIAMLGHSGAALPLEALIEQADQAMYLAKTTGRNRICVWGQPLSLEAERGA